MRVILGSSSPRRRDLLKMVDLSFEVHPPEGVEEKLSSVENLSPEELVVRLALLKARSVARKLLSSLKEGVVIGADTVVELEGRLFGKPASKEEAFHMIRSLQGRTHRVLTGLGIVHLPSLREESAYEVTLVRFSPLSDRDIESYLRCGEWRGKAGAYAIQGKASLFVERIEGCYFNVVGLPLNLLRKLLFRFGVNILEFGGGGN